VTVIENARALGFGNSLVYGVSRALAKSGLPVELSLDHLVAQRIAASPLLPPRRGTSIEVREISADDPALAAMPLEDAERDHRRRIGAMGFGAFLRGEMIGYLWFSLTYYDERQMRLRFVPHPQGTASWDFDIYLLPEHRAGFGFLRLWDVANEALRARGIRWTVSRINAFNPVSIASHKRLGAVMLRKVTTLRIGRWWFHVATRPLTLRFSDARGSWATLDVHAPQGE
jgi:hypothetical protein